MIKSSTQKELLKKTEELKTEQQTCILIEEQYEKTAERVEILLNALPVGIAVIDY